VVPPHATPEAARAAMARAVHADNLTQAQQILIDTGTDRARPITTEDSQASREGRNTP
jgi:hypothetical protein